MSMLKSGKVRFQFQTCFLKLNFATSLLLLFYDFPLSQITDSEVFKIKKQFPERPPWSFVFILNKKDDSKAQFFM